ncbi:MAG TPA: phosphotransferase, partial [Chthoniobacterales bacterium]|nr:phosphotransferase [Chthoniobacterales bacterium]
VSELAGALNQAVRSCDLLAKNSRNRIYRVQLTSGALAVAKQAVVGNDAMVQHQCEQLKALGELGIPGLRIPRVLASIPWKRTYVMEFARGQSLRDLARRGTDGEALLAICKRAGEILGRIHLAWTQEIAPMPVDTLAADFAHAPWRLSPGEEKILQTALERLIQAKVSMGQVYYDYQAKNLLVDGEQLWLIDPPDFFWEGVHLWDVARFRAGLRRLRWRSSLRRPFQRERQAVAKRTASAFQSGYFGQFNARDPEPRFVAAATRLFELQHTAMSMVTNAAKRKQNGAPPVRLLRGVKVGVITLPLLELEKRWLFHQLADELR